MRPDGALWRRGADLAQVESPDRAVVVRLAAPEEAPRILTGTAAFIWTLLDGTRSSSQIVAEAAEEYACSPSEIAVSTTAFLDELVVQGLAARE